MRTFGLLMLFLPILCLGCSQGPSPAKGGTPGIFRIGNSTTSEILLHVHRKMPGGFEEIGFGQTADDGSFVLYNSDASSPLWLESGHYSFTVESIGAPLKFPKQYLTPQTSPLQIQWTDQDTLPTLEVPEAIFAVAKR